MKKFLSNRLVMIALIVSFAVITTITLILTACPVFYAGSYSGSHTVGGVKTKEYFDFNSNNVMSYTSIVTKDGKETKTEIDYWYYREGDDILVVGTYESMTKEEFEEEVREILDSSKFKDEIDEYGCEIDFASVEMGERDYTNKTAITTVSCLAVIDLAVVVFAVLSVLLFIKAKKTAPVVEENKNTETVAE